MSHPHSAHLSSSCRLPPRLHKRRPHGSTLGPEGVVVWWHVVALCVAFALLAHHHAPVVRAQFPANPIPILNTTFALHVNGIVSNDLVGRSVAGVGDVNGDGMDDFVVASSDADPLGVNNAGQAYLLFGRNASMPWEGNVFDLSNLDGTNGVTFNGVLADESIGRSAAGVQDVNGDGINDFILGTLFGDEAYLVFGMSDAWPAVVNLNQGAFDGVTIVGQGGDDTGYSVAGAGDVNHDGMADIALGNRYADTPEGTKAGRLDVLYGRAQGSPWPALVNLTTDLNPSTGFSVLGEDGGGNCGAGVSGVGDVNGDGVDDVAVGCTGVANSVGIVAVVFGSSDALPAEITPSQLDGTNGFVVTGQQEGNLFGRVPSRAGDVNGDGLDDFAVGAPFTDANGLFNSGEVHVLFGHNASATPWPAQTNVSSLNASTGFTLEGSFAMEGVGSSVSAAGDVNADGIDDLLVGAPGDDDGRAFLLYGRAVWPVRRDTSALDDSMSTTFVGDGGFNNCGYSVSRVGDVNGDGRGDLAIGCLLATPSGGGRNFAGQVAVVFGPLFTPVPTTATPTAAPTTPAPTTAAPTTAAPTTAAPTTAAPTTATPTTAAPTTAAPTTAAPTTAAPTTAAPTTAAPTTATPTTGSPITSTPTTGSPITSTPITGSPITATPITDSPTSSPTPNSCATEGAFIPPGATCVDNILITSTNTTTPVDTIVTVTTSVTITGGASFEQPGGSTLVFVAEASGQSTSIAVQGGGCANIGGDVVVSFAADPSNGGVAQNTGSLVLVTADCVVGAFGSVTATTSFEGDECVAIDDGVQQVTGSSITVSFDVTNTCGGKSSGLATGVLVGIIAGCIVVAVIVGIVIVVLQKRSRMQRRAATLGAVSMLQSGAGSLYQSQQ